MRIVQEPYLNILCTRGIDLSSLSMTMKGGYRLSNDERRHVRKLFAFAILVESSLS